MSTSERPAWDSVEQAQAYAAGLLCGERVRLRPVAETDIPAFEEFWSNPEMMVLNQGVVRPRPEGQSGPMLRDWSTNGSNGSATFSVVDRASGELYGQVSLFGIAYPQRSGTLGIFLLPGHTGRGIGTDATRTMTRYGFDELGLYRIELGVFAYNTRGIGAYEKVGYQLEGRRRSTVFHDGRFHDELVMSILEPEWRALVAAARADGESGRPAGQQP